MPIDPSIPLGAISQQPQQGLNPFTVLSQVQQMQQRQQQMQQEKIAAQKAQDALDDEQAIGQALQKHAKPNGDVDTDAVGFDLQSAGRGNAYINWQNKVIDWRKAQAAEYKDQVEGRKAGFETAGRIAQGVLDSNNPEQAYQRATPLIQALVGTDLADQYWGKAYDADRVKLAASGAVTAADHLAQEKFLVEESDKALDRLRDYIKDQATQQKERPGIINQWTEILSKKLSLPGTVSDVDWQRGLVSARTMMAAAPDIRDEVVGQFAPTFSPQAKEDARQLGMTVAQRSEEQSRKKTEERLDQQANDVPALSDPVVLGGMAKAVAEGVPIGNFVRGWSKPAQDAMGKIWSEAFHKYEGMDLAEQQAAFTANKAALTRLVPTAAALQAWESTGLKNARVFLEQAQKVVDTGSPWINEPLRKIDEKAFGSTNVATYNAARNIVTPEFAKLLSNPALTGPLTDTARSEVNAILSGDFTYKQAYDVIKIFATDAENRRKSMDDQIDYIKRIISTPPGQKAGGGESGPKEGDEAPVPGHPGVTAVYRGGKWIVK